MCDLICSCCFMLCCCCLQIVIKNIDLNTFLAVNCVFCSPFNIFIAFLRFCLHHDKIKTTNTKQNTAKYPHKYRHCKSNAIFNGHTMESNYISIKKKNREKEHHSIPINN